MIERALKWLETQDDNRLGGRCLIGLAFYKAGRKLDHSKIVQAQNACQSAIGNLGALDMSEANYSLGLALVFLLETSPEKNRSLADRYVTEILKRQKSWG